MTVLWFTCLAAYSVAVLPNSLRMKILMNKGEAEKCKKILYKMAPNLVRRMFRLANIKLHIEGLDLIPDGNVLYVANHQGLFDAGIMLMMREPCGYVIKKEAEKIPLLSTWMKYLGSVFIDRDNPRKAAEAINQAAENIKNGDSMVIFPEGTRSRGGEVGEFKSGAFKIAQKTGVNIVPVAISGSYKTWEEHHKIHSADIYVTVLPHIETKDMNRAEIKALGTKIRDMIVDELKKH